MKMPIEAVIELLKNIIRRVFDEKLVYRGIRRRSQNKFFGNLAASWLFWFCQYFRGSSQNNIFWKFYFGSKS